MITFDLYKEAKEIAKAEANGVTPKSGSTIYFNQYMVCAGAEAIKKIYAEKEPEIKSNAERYVKKVADEVNAPIIAKLNEESNAVKNSVRTHVSNNIDARVKQINHSRTVPIRESIRELFQTIKTLIDVDADIPESDWKTWEEQCAGHYLEEKVLIGLAKKKGIDILPVTDPDKSIERLETFKNMANIAIDNLDNPDNSITALSFMSKNPNSPLAVLMNEIDSDLISLIPAEKLTVMKRLKAAKENSFNKDNIRLSVAIDSFIKQHENELSTPEELKESLYNEAEDFIRKGMSAKKGDE